MAVKKSIGMMIGNIARYCDQTYSVSLAIMIIFEAWACVLDVPTCEGKIKALKERLPADLLRKISQRVGGYLEEKGRFIAISPGQFQHGANSVEVPYDFVVGLRDLS